MLLVALAGCGPYAPRSFPLGVDESALGGTWRSEDGAEIVFAGDGTLTYSGLPADLPTTSGFDSYCDDVLAQSTDRVGGSGDWSLEDSGSIFVTLESGSIFLYPVGFLSFSGLEYLCDVDGVGAYRFDRED